MPRTRRSAPQPKPRAKKNLPREKKNRQGPNYILVFSLRLCASYSYNGLRERNASVRRAKLKTETRAAEIRWRQRMEEVFKMYAQDYGDPDREPAELDPDLEEDFDDEDEDEEVETFGVLTSSDSDEGVVEGGVIVIVEDLAVKPAGRKAA